MPITTAAGWRTATRRAPGTCGELAQGQLPGGQRFHVTCPIDRSSTMRVRVREADQTSLTGLPDGWWKTRQAVLRAAELLELGPVEIELQARSELDPAKGMASSSADIVAAVRALAAATGQVIDDASLAQLAAGIEPTDGVMFRGVTAVDQQTGAVVRDWDWAPAFVIAMFTPVDRRDTDPLGGPDRASAAVAYERLLGRLDDAVAARDAAAFAAEATHSAHLNESFAPNPLLPHLAPHRLAVGAAGVCVGHSGTVCGLLFHGTNAAAGAAEAADRLPRLLPDRVRVRVARMPGAPA